MNTITPATFPLAAGQRSIETPCEWFTVRAITGAVMCRLEIGGEWFPLVLGDYFHAPPDEVYKTLHFKGGVSVTLLHGYGSFSAFSTTGGAGVNNNIVGAVDDPNGVHVPTDTNAAAIYYKDQAAPVVQWNWSIINQNWFVVMS